LGSANWTTSTPHKTGAEKSDTAATKNIFFMMNLVSGEIAPAQNERTG
jgi:hypothetical protein